MGIRVWTTRVGSEEEFTEADIDNLEVLDDLQIGSGRPLAERWPALRLTVVSKWPPADSFRCGPLLIVSDRMIMVLRKWGASSFEALPVEVIYQGSLAGEFYFAHVTKRIDVLDRASSSFTELQGVVDDVDSFRVDSSLVGDEHFFEQDSIEWILCVSDQLCTEITTAGLTGVRFVRPEEWQPY